MADGNTFPGTLRMWLIHIFLGGASRQPSRGLPCFNRWSTHTSQWCENLRTNAMHVLRGWQVRTYMREAFGRPKANKARGYSREGMPWYDIPRGESTYQNFLLVSDSRVVQLNHLARLGLVLKGDLDHSKLLREFPRPASRRRSTRHLRAPLFGPSPTCFMSQTQRRVNYSVYGTNSNQ